MPDTYCIGNELTIDGLLSRLNSAFYKIDPSRNKYMCINHAYCQSKILFINNYTQVFQSTFNCYSIKGQLIFLETVRQKKFYTILRSSMRQGQCTGQRRLWRTLSPSPPIRCPVSLTASPCAPPCWWLELSTNIREVSQCLVPALHLLTL